MYIPYFGATKFVFKEMSRVLCRWQERVEADVAAIQSAIEVQ